MLKSSNIKLQCRLIVQELTQSKINVSEFAQMTGYHRRKVADVLKSQDYDLDIIEALCAQYLNKQIKFELVDWKFIED